MRDVVAPNQTNARDCLRAAPDEAVNPVPNGEKGELENSNTNGFLRTLRGYAVIGGFPVSLMDVEQEFSPIDAVASAC